MSDKSKQRARALMAKTGMRYQAAKTAGASEPINLLHSFRWEDDPEQKFSQRCPDCNRWICCEEHLQEGSCYCGEPFRIVFDAPADRSMAQGRRCMDCGAAFRPADLHESRSPWRPVNQFQIVCRACVLLGEKVTTARSLARLQRQSTEHQIAFWATIDKHPDLHPLIEQVRAKQKECERLNEACIDELAETGEDADDGPLGSALTELAALMQRVNGVVEARSARRYAELDARLKVSEVRH